MSLCTDIALAEGPVIATAWAGDLGGARRLCTRDEIALGGGALIVADTAHFYGHIVLSGDLSGSYALSDATEVFANVEAFRMDSILGAIPASSASLGHVSLGATHALVDSDTLRGGLHVRTVLPTALGIYEHGRPFGLDVGFGLLHGLSDKFFLHEDLDLLGSFVFGGGTGGVRGGLGVIAGAEWRPGKAFGLVLDVHGGFGYTAAIDDISIAPGFRFAGGEHFGIELDVLAPLVGRDRAPLAAADLRASWRL